MKLIAIGDIHASGFGDDPVVGEYPQRLFYIQKSLEYIINYGKSHGITTFVMVGDIYNDKTLIYNEAQNMLTDILKSNEDCKFVMFSGNHDLSSTGEHQKSAVSVFQKFPNVDVYLYEAQMVSELNAVIVPYCHNFIDQVKRVSKSFDGLAGSVYNPNILFAHVGLNEGVLQSGLSRVDKLKLTDIDQFPLAILGHYHKPQAIQGSKTTAYYVGSLIPKDWNDKNETKRFLVVDTDSLEVESVDLNVPEVKQFYEFVIKSDTLPEERKIMLERAATLKDQGHHVRVVNRSATKVAKEETVADMVILENVEVDVTDRGINITQSKMDQCKKYLEIKKVDNPDEYLKILTDKSLLEIGAENE